MENAGGGSLIYLSLNGSPWPDFPETFFTVVLVLLIIASNQTNVMASNSNNIEVAPPSATSPSAVEAAQAKDVSAKQRGLEPPEVLRTMSAEERAAFEKKLRRKIDLRLLPMIIVMYILNYIDRFVFLKWEEQSAGH